MATLKELRDERLRKLDEIKKLGVNPYPEHSGRTHTAEQITSDFEDLQSQTVTLAGRLLSTRKFGKIAFFILKDATGNIQLFLKHDTVEELHAATSQLGFSQINLLDPGDFIEVVGPVIKTQTGEISVEVQKLRLLTKSLRPMPTSQEGFTNKEERLRRRYIDMNVNKDVYERFLRRSAFWRATRDFLNNHGFNEINIPVLEHTTGGADANPFVTHMDALGQDFYLRISHELPLKRLIGAGYERVYDIGPRFRNENYSDEHLPEHVAMEWYWAYADWKDGMRLTQDLFRYVMNEVYGTLKFHVKGFDIDLEKDWVQLDYATVIKDHFGLDVFSCTLEEVKEQLTKHRIEVERSDNKARGIDKLWKSIRSTIGGPAFLVNTPLFISPLSKASTENPNMVDRFQPIIAGSELGNGWSELNDPVDQLHRFLEQQRLREAGDDEAQMLDIDYVEMLEYGMPPACGYGHSERVFWTFEGVTAREGVPFPQLRSEIDPTTRSLYPEVFEGANPLVHPPVERHQDFSKRIVAVINKDLEAWQAANAVAHMTAIIGNETGKEQLTSGDVFVGQDGVAIPRNSQYPIIIKSASDKELHTLYTQVETAGLLHHVFIKEMQDTTDDAAIVKALENQPIADTTFYGVTFLAPNDQADQLAKNFQLFK